MAGLRIRLEGTSKADKSLKRVFRPFLRLCHLKLVVRVPGKEEQVVARFTSCVSKRKVGRLEVFEDVIDSLLSESLVLTYNRPEGVPCQDRDAGEEKEPRGDRVPSGEKEKEKLRLRDLVVATGICMVIGEWSKRQVVIGIIVNILNNIP